MNVQKVKTLFFAQYLGQKILHWEKYHSINSYGILDGSKLEASCSENQNSHILLRSISQLTKEEKFIIASLVCKRHNRHYPNSEIAYEISKKRDLDVVLLVAGVKRYIVQITKDGLAFVNYYMGGAGEINNYCPGQYNVVDFMRSIGILIEFTYLNEENKPITLQPNEIIELDWAKIQE